MSKICLYLSVAKKIIMYRRDLRYCFAQFYKKSGNTNSAFVLEHFVFVCFPRWTIYKILQYYNELGTVDRKPKRGRPRTTGCPKNAGTAKKLSSDKDDISVRSVAKKCKYQNKLYSISRINIWAFVHTKNNSVQSTWLDKQNAAKKEVVVLIVNCVC